jgi:signal transduction histidine kinase
MEGKAPRPSGPARSALPYLLGYAAFASLLLLLGLHLYSEYEANYRREVSERLSAIADLKVGEILRYREERLADARLYDRNLNFSVRAREALLHPGDAYNRMRLRIWLTQVRRSYGYDRVSLLNLRGEEILSDPSPLRPVSSVLRARVPEALRSPGPLFVDLYRDEGDRRIYLTILVPVREITNWDRLLAAYGRESSPSAEALRARGPEWGAPIALMALRIDPTKYLYPFLRVWPSASRTAETLIVRREGDRVVFLNDPKFRKDGALRLSFPLSRTDLPATAAVRGRRGVMEGRDYRGVPVLACIRPVPGSPWFLVARMDLEEVRAPLRERLGILLLAAAALLVGAGGILGWLWHRRDLRFYRERYESTEILRERERELREKNAEMERFTYTISHDLKSPLVTVQTFLGYLEQDLGADPERAVQDMAYVRTAADRMGRLLKELLEMSRIGRIVTPPTRATFRELAEEARAAVAGAASLRGVEIRIEGGEGPLLEGDRPRLVELCQNLMENAVKYMGDQTEPRVEAGWERSGPDRVFYVRDNGMGFDPRFREKIFGLFEKLDPNSEGTGFGLALARRIAELHGGTLWAESEGEGRGSCFRFTLPGAIREAREGGGNL